VAKVLRSLQQRPAVASKSEPWWESKVFLLLLGALLTTFLAPRIQQGLERIKWLGQQQVEDRRVHLNSILTVSSDVADLHSRTIDIETTCRIALMATGQGAGTDVSQRLSTKRSEWQRLVGKISGATSLFEDSGQVREALQQYVFAASEALLQYQKVVVTRRSSYDLDALRVEFSGDINKRYESLQNAVRVELHRFNGQFRKQLAGGDDKE